MHKHFIEWFIFVVVVQLENWSIGGIFYGFIENCDFALLLLELRTNSGHLRDIIACTFVVHLSDSVRLIELHKSDCSYVAIFCGSFLFCFSLDEIISEIFLHYNIKFAYCISTNRANLEYNALSIKPIFKLFQLRFIVPEAFRIPRTEKISITILNPIQ